MKWGIQKNERQPQEGDLRRVTKFALFPVLVKKEWVWLEYIVEVQYYVGARARADGRMTSGYWAVLTKEMYNNN